MTDSRSWLIGAVVSLPLRRWPPVEPSAFAVDEAELEGGVAHAPFAQLGSVDPDRLADQHLADEDQIALPLDLAVGPHAADDGVAAVARLAQGARIGSRRGPIQAGGILERQSFVRPLGVEDTAELV